MDFVIKKTKLDSISVPVTFKGVVDVSNYITFTYPGQSLKDVTSFNFDSNNLDQLPQCVLKCNLRFLDLGHCYVTSTLSDQISEFANLVSLFLHRCGLKELSNELAKCRHLSTIFLSGNQFEEIPSVCFSFSGLTLHLDQNELKCLPYNLNSKFLNKFLLLNISNNPLKHVYVRHLEKKVQQLEFFDTPFHWKNSVYLASISKYSVSFLERLDAMTEAKHVCYVILLARRDKNNILSTLCKNVVAIICGLTLLRQD